MKTFLQQALVAIAIGTVGSTAGAQHVAANSSAALMQQEQHSLAVQERQKKMLEDADKLLVMAQQLKVSVDKTSRDELSLRVIHQADEIEKLARQVKDRMKQ